MRRRDFFAMVAGLCGCSSETGPTEPVWGKVACSECAMLVADKRFAAQLLEGDGTRLYFDDVGCLAHYMDTHSSEKRHGWVRDVEADKWLSVESARYTGGIHTPMDYGFSASADHGDFSFSDVRKAVAEKTARPAR